MPIPEIYAGDKKTTGLGFMGVSMKVSFVLKFLLLKSEFGLELTLNSKINLLKKSLTTLHQSTVHNQGVVFQY